MRPRSRKPMLHRLVAAAALFSCVLTPVTGGADAYVTSAVDPASATVTLGDPVRYNLTISHSADLRPDRVSLSEFDVDVDVTIERRRRRRCFVSGFPRRIVELSS